MRKPRDFSDELLQQVAKWFYEDGESKKWIAEQVRTGGKNACDRHTVSHMLKLARERQLVVIDFPKKKSRETLLARKLQRKFAHLRRVVIIPNKAGESYEDLIARWGAEAARILEDLIEAAPPKDLHIGVSGGDTLFSFVNAVREHPRPRIHVHTTALVGRGHPGDQNPESQASVYHIDPLTNATLLFTKFGKYPGHCHYATVPPLGGLRRQDVKDELDRLYRRKSIGDTIDDMEAIDIAFVGLGLFAPIDRDDQNPNQLTMSATLQDFVHPSILVTEGVIGDLAYSLYGEDGRSEDRWEFFLTAGYGQEPKCSGIKFYQGMVTDKRRKRYVVVIAGARKHRALLPALRAKCFNVWVTDTASAEHVLNQSASSRRRVSASGSTA